MSIARVIAAGFPTTGTDSRGKTVKLVPVHAGAYRPMCWTPGWSFVRTATTGEIAREGVTCARCLAIFAACGS